MAPPLLFMPSTFLTAIGLSNFYSLNLCLATVCLSINIPVTLLSKSTLIITPSYIFIFSTPIFNYTSLNILKVLLTSFRLPPFLAVLSGSPDHVLLCCAFAFLGHTVFSSLAMLLKSLARMLFCSFPPLHPY